MTDSPPSARSAVSTVVEQWKRSHREPSPTQMPRATATDIPVLKQGLDALRIPEVSPQSTPLVETASLVRQCAQTVAWLAEVIVDERKQMEEWMCKMEEKHKTLGDERAVDAINLALTSNGRHLESLLSQELKGHQAWVADKLTKLASLMGPHNQSNDGGVPEHTHMNERSRERPASVKEVSSEVLGGPELEQGVLWSEADTNVDQLGGGPPSPLSTDYSKKLRSYGMHGVREEVQETSRRMIQARKSSARLAQGQDFTVPRLAFQAIASYTPQESIFKRMPKNRCTAIVKSQTFGCISLSALTLNAAWIGYQTETRMNDVLAGEDSNDSGDLRWVGRTFSIIFTLELAMRLYAYRFFFFISKEWKWNVYDLFVVLACWVEDIIDTINLNYMRTIRILKMIRLTRFIRVFRFSSRMRHLLLSFMSCLPLVGWISMFLAFLTYMYSILFMQVVIFFHTGDLKEKTGLLAEIDHHYGSVGGSMFTLLLAVSGGEPWYKLMKPLEGAAPALSPIFCSYVIIVVFGLLNILTAVYVQYTADIAEFDRELSVQRAMESSERFGADLIAICEEQGFCASDYLERDTFDGLMAHDEVQMFFQGHDITHKHVLELFEMLDAQDEGRVPMDHFIFGCQRLKSTACGMDIVLLYDQVLDTKNRLTHIMDKQGAFGREIRQRMDQVVASVNIAKRAIDELSADFQIHTDTQNRQAAVNDFMGDRPHASAGILSHL